MKIACEACGAKYTIADDKVRGRRVKIRCKGCGTPIVVDGQQGGESITSDVETDAALEPSEAAVTWSVNLSDTDSRTMSAEEIVEAYASGVVTADAFVWKDGMADWVPLLQSELAPLLPSAPAAAQATPFAPAPTAVGVPREAGSAPRHAMPAFGAANQPTQGSRTAATTRASQPDNTQDLFGAIGSAGADDEEVATSAPTIPHAGTAAYDDGKLTGARNENSVLFSLDALKAGFSPSASPNASKPSPKVPVKSAPGAARPQQHSDPDDPFGMGAGNGLMGMGGTSGVLFGADNQALLAAPPPPPPSPPASAQFAPGATPVAAPSNNKLLYIVGGAGGVVIVGLLLALLMGKKPDAAPAADSSAVAHASAAPVTAQDKPEPKPEEPAKPSEAPSASAAPAASVAPEAKPVEKPATTPQAGPAPVKKPKEDTAPAPAADAAPFSKASAISALGAAASAAGSCKKPGGPTGAGKATVTFAPSGRVTTATIAGGSYAGTPVGGCVASVFRRAHVPPFSGSAVTVSKSFQIN